MGSLFLKLWVEVKPTQTSGSLWMASIHPPASGSQEEWASAPPPAASDTWAWLPQTIQCLVWGGCLTLRNKKKIVKSLDLCLTRTCGAKGRCAGAFSPPLPYLRAGTQTRLLPNPSLRRSHPQPRLRNCAGSLNHPHPGQRGAATARPRVAQGRIWAFSCPRAQAEFIHLRVRK